MTENKAQDTQKVQPADDEDVEGHTMVINPTVAGDLARVRSRELEREAREHARAKEAKR